MDYSIIDFTNLKPDLSEEELFEFLNKAKYIQPYSVCVSPDKVYKTALILSGEKIKITTVVGFPSGNHKAIIKAIEAKEALNCGADEIDYVINRSLSIDGIVSEAECIKNSVGKNVVVKAILEVEELSIEKVEAICFALRDKVDFVKTSTGMIKKHTAFYKAEIVRKMKKAFQGKVKASGGISTEEDFQLMIDAGADRIGTSSTSGY